MSRYLSEKYSSLVPYTPGEQPKDRVFIKLNTNESPFPPSPKAITAAKAESERLELYSDPDCTVLVNALSKYLGINETEVICTNGSDEALNFCFMAYCDNDRPAVFADITYGFYPVFADVNHIPTRIIPLKQDFSIEPSDYYHADGTVFIANPNAPTSIALTLNQVEQIVLNNPENVVVIDEAYVDFGAESTIKLIHRYPNLIVIQTFSKSRSMAGARLGFAVGNASLIADLNAIRFSTNPYNVNRMTLAAGAGALADEEYTKGNCAAICAIRDRTVQALRARGFILSDSKTNFIFAKHPSVSGNDLYIKLRERGILVRHFSNPMISDYNRITVGSEEQMDTFMKVIDDILEEII